MHDQMIDYKTKDLGEAAILLIKGQRMSETKWEGSVCWFIFGDIDSCTKLSNEYFYGELSVDAKSLVETMRRLKGRVTTR